MPWLRIDDRTADDPSILAAGDAAVGAWVRLGAWVARHCTDGAIPVAAARMIAGDPIMARLVKVGLLIKDADGFKLAGDLAHVRSREDVEADRAASRDRVTSWRARRKAARDADKAVGNASGNANCNAVTNAVRNAPCNAAPSRPDPVPIPIDHRKEKDQRRAAASLALFGELVQPAPPAPPTRARPVKPPLVEVPPSAFDAFYARYPRRGEGKAEGRKVFLRDVTTTKALDEINRALDAYAARLTADGTERKYIKHFSTFMHCWRDFLDEPAPDENGDQRGPQERALDEYQAARERVRSARAEPGDLERVQAWEQRNATETQRREGVTA